ncbi:hypothetical protein ENUP19_0304G0057 [Entamoeba nuttalli]|uniref:Uncharacterized protein n=1 Tax=Entamoeba nuttalli TaxID=412467 RepID=A0ABQ0DV72_9EUKA
MKLIIWLFFVIFLFCNSQKQYEEEFGNGFVDETEWDNELDNEWDDEWDDEQYDNLDEIEDPDFGFSEMFKEIDDMMEDDSGFEVLNEDISFFYENEKESE